jgi:alkylation response protein AidB-like acyl-CoA dehydrogenase
MAVETRETTGRLPYDQDYYLSDPAFVELMRESLGPEVYAWGGPMLEDMGRLAARTIAPLSFEANAHPPVLVQYDAEGNRIDEVRVHASYREMTRLAYGAGLGGMVYNQELRDRHGYVPHALNFGMGYLFSQGEQGLYCPVCMTEGAARLVDKFAEEGLKRRFLPGLSSRNLETLLQGAMFLTEKQGGSDVGANLCVARPEGDHWTLHGDKWFCSNAGEAGVHLVLARPEGAPAGTRGLGLFLMPKHLEDGRRNPFLINRLKDKLGTRSMPSGEITLNGAIAYAVGDLGRGFHYMTEMLNMSRLYNAVASVSVMKRALAESVQYAHTRVAFGRPVDEYPMVRQQLFMMTLEHEASVALVWEAIRLLDRLDQGLASEDEQKILRLLTPLLKYHTAKQAVRFCSEACEMLGGNGYIETFVTPRLLRDAQVLPIWEGTTNILVLDMLRGLGREQAGVPLMASLRERVGGVSHPALQGQRERLQREIDRLEKALGELMALDEPRLTLHAKTWGDRAIRVYEAVVLLGQAGREQARGGSGRKKVLLDAHVARFLTASEFGATGWSDDVAPYEHFESVVYCS